MIGTRLGTVVDVIWGHLAAGMQEGFQLISPLWLGFEDHLDSLLQNCGNSSSLAMGSVCCERNIWNQRQYLLVKNIMMKSLSAL